MKRKIFDVTYFVFKPHIFSLLVFLFYFLLSVRNTSCHQIIARAASIGFIKQITCTLTRSEIILNPTSKFWLLNELWLWSEFLFFLEKFSTGFENCERCAAFLDSCASSCPFPEKCSCSCQDGKKTVNHRSFTRPVASDRIRAHSRAWWELWTNRIANAIWSKRSNIYRYIQIL